MFRLCISDYAEDSMREENPRVNLLPRIFTRFIDSFANIKIEISVSLGDSCRRNNRFRNSRWISDSSWKKQDFLHTRKKSDCKAPFATLPRVLHIEKRLFASIITIFRNSILPFARLNQHQLILTNPYMCDALTIRSELICRSMARFGRSNNRLRKMHENASEGRSYL